MCGVMTHDELQDAISVQILIAPPFALGGYTKFLYSLRAVVELHKPKQSLFDDLECAECTSDEKITLSISYPCSTIQAIKKELK
jgi:hypothetical protein